MQFVRNLVKFLKNISNVRTVGIFETSLNF